MVTDRLLSEVEELRQEFPSLEVADGADGAIDIIIPDYRLPVGWTPPAIRILIVCPLLYPDQQPDNFWAQPGILTGSGVPPGSRMGQVSRRGIVWDQYSWHWGQTPWDRECHNMATWIRSVRNFFARQT